MLWKKGLKKENVDDGAYKMTRGAHAPNKCRTPVESGGEGGERKGRGGGQLSRSSLVKQSWHCFEKDKNSPKRPGRQDVSLSFEYLFLVLSYRCRGKSKERK